MSTLAIDIKNVVKRYEEHVAVRDLSLQVPVGSVYGLLGPNGAGKTTTIRMILEIDIKNVVKRYEEHVAVRDLSLQVPVGSVYGLLGPNGAGKTTTIRMILDIILPDAGTISLFGQPNTNPRVLDRVGYR